MSSPSVPFSDPPYLLGLPSPYYKPTHLKWQKACSAFVAEHLLPYAMEWEREETVPDHLWDTFAKANMLIPNLPAPLPVEWLKRLGIYDILGTPVEEWDYLHTGIYLDEMGRSGLSGPGASITTGMAFGVGPILKFGSKELQERFLPELLTCKKRTCIAITEPGAGSDVANIATTAVKSEDGKHYIINGTKKWITNGFWANYAAMAVRTGGPGASGLSMIQVPLKGYPGVTMRRLKVSGQISAGTTFIELDDVKVPVENLIGVEGMGMRYVMTNFNHERLTIAVGVTRQARVALSAAFEYCLKREAFGKSLMDQPVVRHRLAKAGAELESMWAWCEQFLYQMSHLKKEEADVQLGGLTALAKAKAGMVLNTCAETAVLLFGGNGYTRTGQGEIAERIYREVPGARIPGGSEDVMLDLAVRQLVKNFKNQTQMLERPRGDSKLQGEQAQEATDVWFGGGVGTCWRALSGPVTGRGRHPVWARSLLEWTWLLPAATRPAPALASPRLLLRFPSHQPNNTTNTATTTITTALPSTGLVATPVSALRDRWISETGLATSVKSGRAFDNDAHDIYTPQTIEKVIADEGATGWNSYLVATAEESAQPDMLRLLSWGSTGGGDKGVEQDWKRSQARKHILPSKEPQPAIVLKRKRPDIDVLQTTPPATKKRVASTNGPVPVKREHQVSSLPSVPPLDSQGKGGSPAPPAMTNTEPIMDSKIAASAPGASSTPKKLTEAQLQQVRSTVDAQLGVEILMKHKELRLIDQELAKCQVALEQLRRCSEIPYPVTRPSLDVSSGIGPSTRRPGLRSLPDSPAPWGVLDGPYTRHYARWLLPDQRFDGSDMDEPVHGVAGKTPIKGRSTRGSLGEIPQTSAKARKHQVSNSAALRGGQVQSHDKSGPMILKRKSDGVMVKLVCIDCGRHNFGSPQGFINHCRIGHGRSFTSHDAAAEACGEAVELDESGAVIGQEPVSTPTTSLVHPLIRSARMLQPPSTPLLATDDGASSATEMVSSQQSSQGLTHKRKKSQMTSPDFRPSFSTPNLSALVRNRGLGLNLESLVVDAKTKVELPDSESEDDEMEIDLPVTETARGRHLQVAGNKHPARSNMSPLSSPTLSRVPMASSQPLQRSQFLNTHLPGYPSPAPSEVTFDSHRYAQPSLGLEPSPTNESHQAPSLVDDDGEEAHSPSNSINFGDGSVDFEVEDDEHGSQSAGSGSGLRPDFHNQTQSCEVTAPAGRPSAIRNSFGDREEKHVSFVSPSPAREFAKTKGGGGEKKRKRN